MDLLGATVCVGEAHAHADTGSDLVEAVPMPVGIAAWVASFVARNHVEEEPYRRRREGVGSAGATPVRGFLSRWARLKAEDRAATRRAGRCRRRRG